MKIQHKFLIFIASIHLIFFLFALVLRKDHPFLFFGIELFLLASLAIFFYFYKVIIRPVDLLSIATENIKGQNFNTKLVEVGHPELDQLVMVYNQMIDHLRLERVQHKEQYFLLNHLIQASPAGIILLDIDDKVATINPSAEKFLGLSKDTLLGESLDRFSGPLMEALRQLSDNVPQTISPNGFHTYQCQKSHFMDHGLHRHFIMIEELTDAILQSEKSAYEKVIRMMSHEVNNSIGAVNSILHLLMNYHAQIAPDDQPDYQEVIEVSLDRNTRLNQFMANFAEVAKLPVPTKLPTDLNKLLQAVYPLFAAESEKRAVDWQWQLAPSPLMVLLDPLQVEQVLINIVKNALEAIDDTGTLVIQTHRSPSPSLKIIDTGKGVDPSCQSKLFTPFFSTKPYGQGIGLTLTREVLLNHGCHFSLGANADGLTEFLIQF